MVTCISAASDLQCGYFLSDEGVVARFDAQV